jgi:hypothetical protein
VPLEAEKIDEVSVLIVRVTDFLQDWPILRRSLEAVKMISANVRKVAISVREIWLVRMGSNACKVELELCVLERLFYRAMPVAQCAVAMQIAEVS